MRYSIRPNKTESVNMKEVIRVYMTGKVNRYLSLEKLNAVIVHSLHFLTISMCRFYLIANADLSCRLTWYTAAILTRHALTLGQ